MYKSTCHCPSTCRISSKRNHSRRIGMTSNQFFKMAVHKVGNLLPLRVQWWHTTSRCDILNSRLRSILLPVLNYNGRIEIQLSVSTLTYSHQHVILHHHAKFRSNRTVGGGVVTLYRFLRWRPYSLKSTSGLVLLTTLNGGRKLKIYFIANFDEIIIAIHGYDKTTSGSAKRTAVLTFYFRFYCAAWNADAV